MTFCWQLVHASGRDLREDIFTFFTTGESGRRGGKEYMGEELSEGPTRRKNRAEILRNRIRAFDDSMNKTHILHERSILFGSLLV